MSNTYDVENDPVMTTRDHFALQALNGMLACEYIVRKIAISDGSFQDVAAYMAYEFADAMLEAREVYKEKP